MSQSIHLRSGAVKYLLALIVILATGSVLYWALDHYVINPEVPFEVLDIGTNAVAFTEAPHFELLDLASKPVQLTDFKNKVVIVNFWASWCGPCAEEFPSLMKYVDQFKGEVVLLAVSQDSSSEAIHDFLKKNGVATHPAFQVLLDLDRRVGKMYGVGGLPESFIFSNGLKFERRLVGFRDWMSQASIAEIKKLIQKNASRNL